MPTPHILCPATGVSLARILGDPVAHFALQIDNTPRPLPPHRATLRRRSSHRPETPGTHGAHTRRHRPHMHHTPSPHRLGGRAEGQAYSVVSADRAHHPGRGGDKVRTGVGGRGKENSMGSKGSKGTPRARPRAQQRQRADARLDLVIEEFLYECQQTLAPDPCRAYRGPLALFLGDLRETLGHEPLLSDLTLDTVRNWTARLKQRHRMLCGGQVADEAPLAIESVRTYLRTLRGFANWLAQPPHRYCLELPPRDRELPQGGR